MTGKRGSGCDTRWLLANFPLKRKIRVQLQDISKCRENGKDRLRKGNAQRLPQTLLYIDKMIQIVVIVH